MRLLINFAPLKIGGGQNVGLNFVNGLDVNKYPNIEFYFATAKGTEIERELKARGFRNIISLPPSASRRIIKEMTVVSGYIKKYQIDAVYSYFGYAFVSKKVCQICGVADSNLLYPEIDFWEGYSGIGRLKKIIIDEYRKWGYRRADGLVFENEAMEKRAKRIFKGKESVYIKPAFSKPDTEQSVSIELPSKSGLKALFLCGWQRNKGILMIPEIVRVSKKKRLSIVFYISAEVDENDAVCKEFMEKARKYKALDSIFFIGKIDKKQISDLYQKINLVFLLSKLESFSNNIIEAWYYQKPLIIANEEWARGICNEAAIYVSRCNAEEIVNTLISARDSGKLDSIVGEGIKEFAAYPTIEQKIDKEIEYIEKIYRMVKV